VKKIISDEEFMAWAESVKPCRYCNTSFVGPTCPRCEQPFSEYARKFSRRKS